MKRMKRGTFRQDGVVHVFEWIRYPQHDMCKNKPRPLCYVTIDRKLMTKTPGAEITCPGCLKAMKAKGIHESDVS